MKTRFFAIRFRHQVDLQETSHKSTRYRRVIHGKCRERIKCVSTEVGVYCVIVDSKNESAKNLYLKYGFIEFADAPMSLFLPITAY